MKKVIVTALMFLVVMSCSKKIGNKDVNFGDQILPIFVSNCSMSGCHNSQQKAGGYDLSSYEGIMKGVVPKRPLQSEVYTNITGKNPSMPLSPYPKLKEKEVELIKLWINMGAPNTISNSGCDSVSVSYSKSVEPIITTWCVGCHNQNNAGGGISLSTHNDVLNCINSNRLLGSIKHLSGFSPMPKNGGQLSTCDIAKIEKWVKLGAIKN